MDIKTFNTLLDPVKFPQINIAVHLLTCPIVNKKLEKELLCGLDPKYSTSHIIFYSGYIKNTINPFISIACVDLIVTNMLENVETKYLWHGKCFFSPRPAATEIYKNFSIDLIKDDDFTEFTIKQENVFYRAKLPKLTDPSYTVDRPKNTLLSTQNTHLFTNFFSTYEQTYCHKNLSTAVMNINFKDFEGLYYLKLENLDDITFGQDYGKFLGLENLNGKEDLDNSACAASFMIDGNFMDTYRGVSVYKNTTVPVKPGDVSLSKLKDFPCPFQNLNDEVIKNLTLDKNTVRYNLNEKIMETLNYKGRN